MLKRSRLSSAFYQLSDLATQHDSQYSVKEEVTVNIVT